MSSTHERFTSRSGLQLGPLIVVALSIGALVSLTSWHGAFIWEIRTSGFFVLLSGFVLGVFLLIHQIAERLRSR